MSLPDRNRGFALMSCMLCAAWALMFLITSGTAPRVLDAREMVTAARGGAPPDCDAYLMDGKCSDTDNRCFDQAWGTCTGSCTNCNGGGTDRWCSTGKKPWTVQLCTTTTTPDGCCKVWSKGSCGFGSDGFCYCDAGGNLTNLDCQQRQSTWALRDPNCNKIP